jgi:hypothetical protein
MRGKRVQFDDETWNALDLLARDRMQDFQELADEAFTDLLRKHGRPIDLKAALRQSKDGTSEKIGASLYLDSGLTIRLGIRPQLARERGIGRQRPDLATASTATVILNLDNIPPFYALTFCTLGVSPAIVQAGRMLRTRLFRRV